MAKNKREYLQRGERKNDYGDGRLNEKEMLGFRCLDLNKTQNDSFDKETLKKMIKC